MICPKCKAKVSKDDTHCPNCNLRLILNCPRCGSPTRLGSVSCKNCGYTFVKFCPECQSANYATSSVCRKCGHEFENSESDETNNTIINESTAPIKKTDLQETDKDFEKKQLSVFIDFTNIEEIFEKYDNEDFRTKITDNIKASVKMIFNSECEFISERYAKFPLTYSKSTKLLEKLNKFDSECEKLNAILTKTLSCGIQYKFAIATEEEAKKNKTVPQLKHGSDRDIVVSSGAYIYLSNELSLIRISPDSYKLIFLDQKPVFEESKDVKYSKALDLVLENLADNNSSIRAISINAPRGCGKTHLLNNLYFKINELKTEKTAIFYANCSALTQVSPFGLIQNFFTGFFGCPAVLDGEFNGKNFEKLILAKLNLEKIEPETFETISNLIYPIKRDYYENILINKEITFKYLKEIFEYIKQRRKVIFMIDDFDLIDESSFQFLKYLVDEDYFIHNAKMILGYKNSNSAAMHFQSNKLDSSNCLNISLRVLSATECKLFIKTTIGDSTLVPDDVLTEIAINSQGNIAYIEQILDYLFERKILYIKDKTVNFKNASDFTIPETMEDCCNKRLEFLKEQNESQYQFLLTASLLGDKINYTLLNNVFNFSESEFYDMVKELDKKGYLKRKYSDVYGFKNSLTWSYCYIIAKDDASIKQNAEKLLLELNNKVITAPLLCPILAQIINNRELAFNLWTKNLQYASYIGDVNIYTMAQKQSLILLEKIYHNNSDEVKNDIFEKLGKLTYTKNPLEAKNYLTSAIVAAQNSGNINKIIDLSGYLVKSLYLMQDYGGVVEIIDNLLKFFDTEKSSQRPNDIDLQIALIKTRKLEALLALGSWEKIASMVQTEINPVLQKHLNVFAKHSWIKYSEIYFSWVESNIILAQSYSQQGLPLAFELIDEINKFLSHERGAKIDNLKVQLAYASAIANTSRGYFSESDNILQGIIQDYAYVLNDPLLICKWNVVNIINKILSEDYTSIKEDLFEATTFANNCDDQLSKNLLKTLLAYVFLEEKAYIKAIEIATEQVQYFSDKKIAFGALLAWYISAAAMANNKADKYCIEICEKAVKICEDAQNNNFYFKIMFQELLAKSYLKMNDKENAQMYCDLAIQSANTNELLYLQVRLNILKAKIMRENISSVNELKKYDYAQSIIRLYLRTTEMAKLLNLVNIMKRIEKELTSFRAYCQLNRIIEDK